jgi:hypothetical protein
VVVRVPLQTLRVLLDSLGKNSEKSGPYYIYYIKTLSEYTFENVCLHPLAGLEEFIPQESLLLRFHWVKVRLRCALINQPLCVLYMCICMYVFMYVYMYVYIYMRMYVYVCLSVCLFLCVYLGFQLHVGVPVFHERLFILQHGAFEVVELDERVAHARVGPRNVFEVGSGNKFWKVSAPVCVALKVTANVTFQNVSRFSLPTSKAFLQVSTHSLNFFRPK